MVEMRPAGCIHVLVAILVAQVFSTVRMLQVQTHLLEILQLVLPVTQMLEECTVLEEEIRVE